MPARRSLRQWNLRSLRHYVGLVSQEPVLFATTIATNIGYGQEGATMDQIIEAAKAANAHTFISRLPEGYNTEVGEKGVQMSGGQKQRTAIATAIARAILSNPKASAGARGCVGARVLILDEATSARHSKSERIVQARGTRVCIANYSAGHIRQHAPSADSPAHASAGRTTISIAHRLSTIVHSDVIAVVDKGVIVERGKHNELLAKNGMYAALVSKQTMVPILESSTSSLPLDPVALPPQEDEPMDGAPPDPDAVSPAQISPHLTAKLSGKGLGPLLPPPISKRAMTYSSQRSLVLSSTTRSKHLEPSQVYSIAQHVLLSLYCPAGSVPKICDRCKFLKPFASSATML
eukprot:scaffold16.g85.t1